jgi:tyrosyl-tRNA synthetase
MNAPSSVLSMNQLEEGIAIADLLLRTNMANTRAEANQHISHGGVFINNARVPHSYIVNKESIIYDSFILVRRARQRLHLIRVAPVMQDSEI